MEYGIFGRGGAMFWSGVAEAKSWKAWIIENRGDKEVVGGFF